MKFFLIFIYFFTSLMYSQENKKIKYLPVIVSFSDKIIDSASAMSYSKTMEEFKMESTKYPTMVILKGKFKNNQIDVYDIGYMGVFNPKKIESKKIISFEKVTTNLSNGSTGDVFFFNNDNINNSLLITLDKKNGLILNNSEKYRFIYVYFNDEWEYWHISYSNYLEIVH